MGAQVDRRYDIATFDVRASSDEELRPLYELACAMSRERVAEDPEPPASVWYAGARATPDSFERTDWLARSDGSVVARALAWRRLHGDKQNVRNVEIEVRADQRRNGLARDLLREVVRGAAGDPTAIFGFFTTDRIPAGKAFLRRVGAEAGMEMTTNQLDLAATDRALVARWGAAAPHGYRLERVRGDVPDLLLDNVVAGYEAMATTPTGTLRIWDFSASRETVRSFERARHEQGREHLLVLAIDDASGRTAGFSEMSWHPEQPHLVRQNGTAVLTDHQGKGIGKWLKALLTDHVLTALPAARYVRTNNNPVNAPIIAINERLGFRPAWTNTVWQLPIAAAHEYVDGAHGTRCDR